MFELCFPDMSSNELMCLSFRRSWALDDPRSRGSQRIVDTVDQVKEPVVARPRSPFQSMSATGLKLEMRISPDFTRFHLPKCAPKAREQQKGIRFSMQPKMATTLLGPRLWTT